MKENQLIDAINDIHIKDEMQERLRHLLLNTNVTEKKGSGMARKMVISICFIMSVFSIMLYPFFHNNLKKSNSINTNQIASISTIPNEVSISVNELTIEPSNIGFGLLLYNEDFIPMTNKELLEYYNISKPLIKEVLPTLKEKEPSRPSGIYKGDGNIYFDDNIFIFESKDGMQNINVVLSKGDYPYTGISFIIEGYNSQTFKSSVINGVEMTVAHFVDNEGIDKYYAQFMYNGNGYNIYSHGLSLEDITKALVSLIN